MFLVNELICEDIGLVKYTSIITDITPGNPTVLGFTEPYQQGA
jgi:hypothetical protein